MDIQLKRGLLEICALAVLKRGDSYGYQLIKDISVCVEISESTLYPILKRLETAGSLTVYSQEYNGRLRRYYQITEAGRNKIQEFISEWKEVMSIYNFITDTDVPGRIVDTVPVKTEMNSLVAEGGSNHE